MVLENALERRIAVDVASNADGEGVKSAVDDTRTFLRLSKYWPNGDVLFEGLAAAAVNIANGSADLGIGVTVDVLLEKVDEAAAPLQYGKDLGRARWYLPSGVFSRR